MIFREDVNRISLDIHSQNGGMIKITVMNILGRVTDTNGYKIHKGKNSLILNLDPNLPPGLYQFFIEDEFGNRNLHKVIHAKN